MMTSNKPYFIRAMYDWISDNNCTPYIVVDAMLPFVEVPRQFVTDGKIVLNIASTATHRLNLGDDWITFSARFSGIEEHISIPIGAIIAIYAQENSQGMGFEPEALSEDELTDKPIKKRSKTSAAPQFDVISDDTTSSDIEETDHHSDEDSSSDKKRGKPTLTVID